MAIKAEFHTTNLSIEGSPKGPVDMATPSGDQPGICDPLRGLNDEEKSRIQELYDASRSLNEPMEHDREELRDQSNISLFSVIKLTDLAIKRIIKMARNIRPFINMCQEDKIALLKGGCTELMILRSIINYNPEKNSWIVSVWSPRKQMCTGAHTLHTSVSCKSMIYFPLLAAATKQRQQRVKTRCAETGQSLRGPVV